MKRAIGVVVAWCLPVAASGQSVNLDFGDAAGTPGASYGAAGVAGTWNSVTAPTGEPQPLVGLRGRATGATVTQSLGAYFDFDDPGTSGDDGALLDDGTGGFGDVVCTLTFEGLVDGGYEVITYAWTPGNPADTTLVFINDVGRGEIAGGAWPGELAEGVTHVVQDAVVEGGALVISFVGGVWGDAGFLNGVQLRRLSPADLDQDGLVAIGDLVILLGAWGPCKACPADLDGDGEVGVPDLLLLLADWG